MKPISFHEYKNVLLVALGVPLFFWLIIWLEWENSEENAKAAVFIFMSLIHLIFFIPLYLYYPRKINFKKVKAIGELQWSSTFLGSTFYKIKVEEDNQEKTGTLEQEDQPNVFHSLRSLQT